MFVFSCVKSTKLKLLKQAHVPSVQNLRIDIAQRYSNAMLQSFSASQHRILLSESIAQH